MFAIIEVKRNLDTSEFQNLALRSLRKTIILGQTRLVPRDRREKEFSIAQY